MRGVVMGDQSVNLPEDVYELGIHLAKTYSNQYGVSFEEMHETIYCESKYQNVQSNVFYSTDYPVWGVKEGDQELSFGACQIHLPSHPNITKEQAEDPKFCIEFMAKEFAKGNAWKWACHKIEFPQYYE